MACPKCVFPRVAARRGDPEQAVQVVQDNLNRLKDFVNSNICHCCGSEGAFETYRGCTIGRDSLLYFLPLDDPVGSTSVAELVSGNSGTVIAGNGGYPLLGEIGPFVGVPEETACRFEASGGFPYQPGRITLPLSATDVNNTFDGNHAWTVEFYVYLRTQTHVLGSGTLFQAWDGTASNLAAQVACFNSGGGVVVRATRLSNSCDSAVLAPLAYYHVRVTYDGTTMRLYIDGVLASSVASAGSPASGSITATIGNNGDLTGSGFNPSSSTIADVAIYTTAISDFCNPGGEGGGTNAAENMVRIADGSGGSFYDYPIVAEWNPEVRAYKIKAGDALDGADEGTGVVRFDVVGARGPAGGVLSGAFPDPGFAVPMATSADLNTHLADPVDAHDASAISLADADDYFVGETVEEALQELAVATSGRWELVMQDGVTSPPVPVETEAGDDWLYTFVED